MNDLHKNDSLKFSVAGIFVIISFCISALMAVGGPMPGSLNLLENFILLWGLISVVFYILQTSFIKSENKDKRDIANFFFYTLVFIPILEILYIFILN